MPKMKTKRSAAKRFHITGGGGIRRGKAGGSHMMRGKPAKRLRRLRKHSMVEDADRKRIERLLPNSF